MTTLKEHYVNMWRGKVDDYMASHHGMPEVEVRMDEAIVCGVVVPRPGNVSRSQWADFWEKAMRPVTEHARVHVQGRM